MTNQYEVLDRFYENEYYGEMIRVRFPDGEVYNYKYRTMDDVRKMLKNDGKICLDSCYIKDFDCNKLYDSKTEPELELKDFSAYGAFFDGSTIFNEAKFSGKADFLGAEFSGEADFKHAEFSEEADFKHAKFSGKTDFLGAEFSEEADFWGAKFSEEAVFGFAKFSGKAVFGAAKFSGEAVFLGAKFSEYASFCHATFSTAKFSSVTFSNEADFDSINCSGQLLFSNCTFKDKVLFDEIILDTLVFDNCINEYLLDMHSKPQKINSLAFKYLNNLGHFNLNWKEYKAALRKGVDDENEKAQKANDDYRIDQFKMLKENFHNLGDYDAEDEAYVEYKRCQRKEQQGIRKAFSFLFDKIGRYGTDPIRVLFSMLIVILVFGILFWICSPQLLISENIATSSLIDVEISPFLFRPFYFSMVTFFTVGYGDIYPITSLTEILVCIESFCGVFLMSFFSVSLVRKILR